MLKIMVDKGMLPKYCIHSYKNMWTLLGGVHFSLFSPIFLILVVTDHVGVVVCCRSEFSFWLGFSGFLGFLGFSRLMLV
jgi:hypothetical protein